MPSSIPSEYVDLWSSDRGAQNRAYTAVLAAAEQPVDWAYEVWDDVVAHLSAKDNHDRSIAAQLLSRLASSDPEQRIALDFEALLGVTRDERFVTARHALLSLWRVGLAGAEQRGMLLRGLEQRFEECPAEKNCTLIRHDIVVVLGKLFNATGNPAVEALALELIGQETDEKYRQKYAAAWRKRG